MSETAETARPLEYQRVTDCAGRTWQYKTYTGPGGAVKSWLTLPDELAPEGTAQYTVHFPGVIVITPSERVTVTG